MRILNETEANAIYTILVALAGAREDNRMDFVHSVLPDPNRSWLKNGHEEYRFMGVLGYGGKFRNNSNRNNIPHIDYYPENQTAERDAVVEQVNETLRVMFS